MSFEAVILLHVSHLVPSFMSSSCSLNCSHLSLSALFISPSPFRKIDNEETTLSQTATSSFNAVLIIKVRDFQNQYIFNISSDYYKQF